MLLAEHLSPLQRKPAILREPQGPPWEEAAGSEPRPLLSPEAPGTQTSHTSSVSLNCEGLAG